MTETTRKARTNPNRPARRTQSPREPQQFTVDPWILWVAFRHCWVWAIPAGVVIAFAATAYVYQSFVPSYESTHILKANEDYVVFKGVNPVSRNLERTERHLIYNALVIDPVLAEPGLREVPSLSNPETAEAKIRKNLTVGSAGSPSLLTITYRDQSPEAAAMVCNAIADSYLRIRGAFDQTRVSNLERWLAPEITRWEQEVQSHQERVQKLSERVHGYAPGQRLAALEHDNAFSLITELRLKLTDLKVEKALLEAKLAMAESEEEEEEGGVSSVPDLSKLPDVKLTALEPTKAEIEAFVNRDPKVAEANSILQRRKSQILQMEDGDLVRINRGYYQELIEKRDHQEKEVELAKEEARKGAVDALRVLAEAEREYRARKLERDRQIAVQELATRRAIATV